jgi:hypothetical protein
MTPAVVVQKEPHPTLNPEEPCVRAESGREGYLIDYIPDKQVQNGSFGSSQHDSHPGDAISAHCGSRAGE